MTRHVPLKRSVLSVDSQIPIVLPRQAPDKPKKQKETSNALAFFAENATGVPFILTADPAHDTDIVSVDSLDPGSWTVPVAVRITHLLSNLCIK